MTRRRLRTAITVTTMLALTVFAGSTASARTPEPRSRVSSATLADIRSDADWILASQRPDGAIADSPGGNVRPYRSNYASLGLSAAARATDDGSYGDAAWRWLSWYEAHQSPEGYVTDYDAVGGSLRSTEDMDSTDAYAGTFLVAVRAAWKTTRDSRRLKELLPGVRGAVNAIESTQTPDGLTWAKPTVRVKYLMDQAEAYAGLRAAVDLGRGAGDRKLAARADCDAQLMKDGTNALWDASSGGYDWALHADGTRKRNDWAVLYPDALEQVWAAAFGLAGRSRSVAILERLDRAQPSWDEPAGHASFEGDSTRGDAGSTRVGYWPVGAWALQRTGNSERALAALESIRSASIAAGRGWPYTTMTAGQLVVAESRSVPVFL